MENGLIKENPSFEERTGSTDQDSSENIPWEIAANLVFYPPIPRFDDKNDEVIELLPKLSPEDVPKLRKELHKEFQSYLSNASCWFLFDAEGNKLMIGDWLNLTPKEDYPAILKVTGFHSGGILNDYVLVDNLLGVGTEKKVPVKCCVKYFETQEAIDADSELSAKDYVNKHWVDYAEDEDLDEVKKEHLAMRRELIDFQKAKDEGHMTFGDAFGRAMEFLGNYTKLEERGKMLKEKASCTQRDAVG